MMQQPMKSLVLGISSVALLGLTVLPPILYAAGRIPDGTMKLLMLLGTLLWFASAPWWMGREKS